MTHKITSLLFPANSLINVVTLRLAGQKVGRLGEFIMGEDKEAHPVNLDAFCISRYPVTNAEYARIMAHWGLGFEMPTGKENHPVTGVSWYDARDYADWAGMRLLTEAEWGEEEQRRGGERESIRGAARSMQRSATRTSPASARPRRWASTRQPVTARATRRTWPATCGSGATAYARTIHYEPDTRCSSRGSWYPNRRNDNYGFRVGWVAPSSGL